VGRLSPLADFTAFVVPLEVGSLSRQPLYSGEATAKIINYRIGAKSLNFDRERFVKNPFVGIFMLPFLTYL
jgi:hypothetical protein